MIKATAKFTAALLALMSFGARADPIQLKLSFSGSAQSQAYLNGVKPFVDAVNAEGKGLLEIAVYFDGALGKVQAQQPQLVNDGVADIAFIVPGLTPYRFPDNVLLEQPGLFRDAREGTLTYTHLIAAKALRGYEDYFVIGAYTPSPNLIHSRKPIETLAALKGQKIRGNNTIEANALELLGAIPTVLEGQKLADAINRGAIDGAALSPNGLFQFGLSGMATNHYLLGIGVAPLTLVMNRRTFDGLPDPAKALIKKHSGEWAAATWIGSFVVAERELIDTLKSDPTRKVVEPSPSDLEAAQRIYRSIIDSWAAKSARYRQLQTTLETELTAIRSGR